MVVQTEAALNGRPIPFPSEKPEPVPCRFCKTPIEPQPWQFLDQQVWRPGRCACEDEAIAREEAAKEQERREKRALTYSRAFPRKGMGELLNASLANFELRPGAENALEFTQRYIDGFPNPDPPGLILWGDVGNGKSHLAAAIANAADKHTMAVAWMHAPSWLRLLGTLDAGLRESQIDLASTADLLVLDELGGGKLTASRAEWLLSVLDARYRNRLPTVATSNKSRVELGQALTPVGDEVISSDVPDGARLVDRFLEIGLFVQNQATSFRQELATRRMMALKGGTGSAATG